MKPLVAAVLVALAVGAQAQTPELDEVLRARAEQGLLRRRSTSGSFIATATTFRRTTSKRCAGSDGRLSRGTLARSTASGSGTSTDAASCRTT